MSKPCRFKLIPILSTIAVIALGCPSSVEQNTAMTVERNENLPTYTVVAYGDSIFSGFYSKDHPYRVARRAAPYVAGEYLAKKWNANIQVVRRTRAGATAGAIYNDKIIAEQEYMQSPDARVVMFEMCGTNYLNARENLKNQTGVCNDAPLDTVLHECSMYMEQAIQYINATASPSVQAKIIMNLYYPGYNADNSLTACTDPVTGLRINKQDKILPYLARSNWRACRLAEQYGFKCADAFAEMMAADYDSADDLDDEVDSQALRYVSGESEADYVKRITVTLRSTLQDANVHYTEPGTSYDYLLSDNTHPTYYSGTVERGTGIPFAPDFSDIEMVDGKNPEWNTRGHERLGWELSNLAPETP